MKKNTLTITLLCFAFWAFGQERVNAPLPVIQKVNSQLTKSKGWSFQSDGQWISRDNRIPWGESNSEAGGLGYDNFLSYQFRDIKINNDTLVILIKRYRDGFYRYPTIYEDWIASNSTFFYVFEKTELSKFDNIEDGKNNLIHVNAIYSGKILYDSDYMSTIQSNISTQVLSESKVFKTNTNLYFHIAPYKSKNIVQFLIFNFREFVTQGDKTEKRGIKGIVNGDRSTYGEWGNYFFSENLFGKYYYEVDYTTFSQFIKLK